MFLPSVRQRFLEFLINFLEILINLFFSLFSMTAGQEQKEKVSIVASS